MNKINEKLGSRKNEKRKEEIKVKDEIKRGGYKRTVKKAWDRSSGRQQW